MVRVVEVLEYQDNQAVVSLSNGYRASFEFTRDVSDNAHFNWSGLTVAQVKALVDYHNEKGFY